MPNNKISINDYGTLKSTKKAITNWRISVQNKKDASSFMDYLAHGKVEGFEKTSEMHLIRLIRLLKAPLEFFTKPIDQLTINDIEKFDKGFTNGKIKTEKQEPYAQSTQADIKRFFRIYLRWKLGDTEEVRKFCNTLTIHDPERQMDYLEETEVENLYKACKSSSERFIVALLFDAGPKAEELHNLRLEDVKLPSGEENSVQITFKPEYSSGNGRVINLYWNHSLEAVRDFIKKRVEDKIKSKDPLYDKNYANARKILNRLGRHAIKKSLNYQLFRNSSAMYYSTRLTREQLCYRYGWKLSSSVPDVYISIKPKTEDKGINEKFSSTTIEELRKRLEIQEEEIRILKDTQKSMAQVLSKLRKK